MDEKKKLLLGMDLGKNNIQICCYNFKTQEPESVTLSQGEQPYLYPALVGLKEKGKEWIFGEEVIVLKEEGMCQVADNLLQKAMNGEETLLYGTAYSPAFLLEKLFRKCLTLITLKFPGEGIAMLTVTVKELNDIIISVLKETFSKLGLLEDRLTLQSYSLSYEYYALSQNGELKINDIGLFHMDEEEFHFKQISINRRLTPAPAGITQKDFTDILTYEEVLAGDKERLEYCFLNLARSTLHKQLITALYITGTGFEGDWADNALKELCVGRRVFKGQNLYAKGACHSSKEREQGESGTLKGYLLLDSDQVTALISAEGIKNGKVSEIPLWDGYRAWYDKAYSQDFILTEDNRLTLAVKDLFTLKKVNHEFILEGLKVNADKSTRVEISVAFRDKKTAVVHIADKDFGQLVPCKGLSWEWEIKL